jgi:peptidyl-prolyl cis-trans isomerase SurA
MNRFFPFLLVSFLASQNTAQYIDGVAAIIEDHIVLKSELAQMVNMAAIQNRIDPNKNPDAFVQLQNTIVQSMVDQKIMLEMAEIDSIVVEEKEVDQALDQQIQMLVAQAGGEDRAEDALGQPLNDFRREFWYDMRDRLVSERYQQKLLDGISITRSDVVDFFQAYKDSLPIIPMKAKVRHLLIPVIPSPASKKETVAFLDAGLGITGIRRCRTLAFIGMIGRLSL